MSDLHFGEPAVLPQIEALMDDISNYKPDLVAFSGDFSQRARIGEFQSAALVMRAAQQSSETIAVPGNHDVAWWFAPGEIGIVDRMLANYRTYISDDLEPAVAVKGVFAAGLNTSHGITLRTLTWNMRDLSILGDVRPEQIAQLETTFKRSDPAQARIVVMHHNPVKGELSRRFGIKRPDGFIRTMADMKVELILCGHDHQESVTRTDHGVIVSIAGTVSNRSRGGRPSSYNMITITNSDIEVATHIWSTSTASFEIGPVYTFPRISDAISN